MLSTNHKTLLSLLGAVGALALAIGCSSSDTTPAGTGGSAGNATPDVQCTDCVVPPAEPSGAPEGDGTGATLAIRKLFLGDATWDGTPDTDAWKTFGYDLDGYKSTKTSTTHCKVNEGGNKAAIQTDGNNGIDNSFGYNIMPIIVGLAADASTKINENLEGGDFTIIVNVDKIGGGTSYSKLGAALFAGGKLTDATGAALAPKWDGTDEWPVYCELMTDCKASGTKQIADGNTSNVLFPSSYVADGTWVSGSKGDVSLSLSVSGYSLSLTIRQAVLTAVLGSGNPPTSATKGVIAGVLETEELINSLKGVAGNISTSLCEGPTFESIAQQIRAASDIMKTGTQDATATCNGISIGLGFEMSAIKLGKVSDKTPEGTSPCPATP